MLPEAWADPETCCCGRCVWFASVLCGSLTAVLLSCLALSCVVRFNFHSIVALALWLAPPLCVPLLSLCYATNPHNAPQVVCITTARNRGVVLAARASVPMR